MPSLELAGTLLEGPVELIIFDKDGTLIDVHSYWSALIGLRAEKLAKKWPAAQRAAVRDALASAMGREASGTRLKKDGPVGIKPRAFIIETVLRAAKGAGRDLSAAEVTDVFREVDEETFPDIRRYVRLLPGVESFLRRADAAGLKLAIGTSDRTDRAVETFRQFGLLSCFDLILGGDQIAKGKPEPEMALKILEQAGLPPEKTVMVGDHPVDMETAKNARLLQGIGVLTGLADAADFEKMNCPVVRSLDQIKVVP